MKKHKGLFIVLEGLDGAGTTTQCARLAERIVQAGHRVCTTREPSAGPVGKLLRQALAHAVKNVAGAALSEASLALLFAADRVDHVDAEVRPALARGDVVLSDRYVLSSLAYQSTHLPMAWVAAINARACAADLTLFLGVPPKAAAKRRHARGGTTERFEGDSRQRQVAKQYQAAIRLLRGRERVVVLDGTQPIDAVTEAAWKVVQPLLARHRRAPKAKVRRAGAA
ncbi:MAG: dTMP kinase [Myxococcaceae bacterium]